jgi:hypothetical protein
VNPWLQAWDWDWVPVAVLVWMVLLGLLSWLAANITTRPPRHH